MEIMLPNSKPLQISALADLPGRQWITATSEELLHHKYYGDNALKLEAFTDHCSC